MATKSLSPSLRSERRPRRTIAALAFGAILFLIFGSANAYAYWAVTSSLTTSASAGSLQVTSNWTTPVTKTFTNESYSVAGSVTIANTTSTTTRSQTAMPYTLKFELPQRSAGLNPLATVLKVKAWKIAGGVCPAPPTTPLYEGTWDDLITQSLGSSLKPSTSEIWCIATSVDDRSKLGSASGSVSVQPSVSAKLAMVGTNWTKDSASSLGGDQKTTAIFLQRPPRAGQLSLVTSDGLCVDLSQADPKNVNVIQWPCNGQAQQHATTTPVGSTGIDSLYIKIVSSRATGKLLSGVSTDVTAQAPTTPGLEQHWQLQERPNAVLQIVNRSTGKCLTAPNSNIEAQLVQSPCDAANQRQGFRGAPALRCTGDKTEANTYSWSPATPSAERYVVSVPGTGFSHTYAAGITSFKIWETGGSPLFNFSGVSAGTYPVFVTGETSGVLQYLGQITVTNPGKKWLDCS